MLNTGRHKQEISNRSEPCSIRDKNGSFLSLRSFNALPGVKCILSFLDFKSTKMPEVSK
jgi:hypothetical protein